MRPEMKPPSLRFRRQCERWLRKQGASPFAYPLAVALDRGRREILADVRSGLIPATVRGFGDLHDYTDANHYGGAFEWQCEEGTEEIPEEVWTFWSRVQDELHRWIASGEMLTMLDR